mgnify:CR=1 FL=1
MLKMIVNGVTYRAKGLWGSVNRIFYQKPKVLDTGTSLRLILDKKCSVARFGDGEFNIMRGEVLGFQESDSSLADKLYEVIHEKVDGLEIGIPDVFGDLSEYTNKSARFWKAYLGMHRGEMVQLLDLDRVYLNTNMTRFWTGYEEKSGVKEIVEIYQKIWRGRNVVFVEGELTRMGVGNNLFSSAASIKRILCPAKNAWNRYDEILSTILDLDMSKDTLFILALGPTATVLAYDLTKHGYQALDLGHLDVQYEYSLRNATNKMAIEGKYVNENIAGREVSDSIVDNAYRNSIIARIVN